MPDSTTAVVDVAAAVDMPPDKLLALDVDESESSPPQAVKAMQHITKIEVSQINLVLTLNMDNFTKNAGLSGRIGEKKAF
jgi:hypothetical protein